MASEKESKPKGNDKGTPYNAPNRGPNRQERAAKVSSEISALAADLPKANLNGRNAEVEGAQPKSPGVSPQAQGKEVGAGAMGENDSPQQEGPLAQGAGGVARGTVEDAGSPKQALKSSSNTDTPTPTTTSKPTEPSKQTVAPTANSKSSKKASRHPTAEDYLSQAPGISTLLGSGAPGMITDRGALLSPRSTPSSPTSSEIAHRLRHHPRQITAFRSRAEKEAYTKPLRDVQAKQAQLAQEAEKAKKENGEVPAALKDDIVRLRKQARTLTEFRPLPDAVQQGIINRMVLGKYDEQGLLSGKQVHRQPQLNTVAQELLKNSTYLAKDSEKLLSKLRGLLPTAAPAAKKAPAAKAKA